jgi:hypothetical protein
MRHITWYTATDQDRLALEQMDLVCFDLNWDRDTWGEVVKSHQVRVAKLDYHKPVAFWVAGLKQSELLDDASHVNVIKLGVMPCARGIGLSYNALRDVWQYAGTHGRGTTVGVEVCEYLLDPNWPDSFIGHWLPKVGFRLFDPVLIDCPHSLYGVDFQHAVRYRLHTVPQLSAGVV